MTEDKQTERLRAEIPISAEWSNVELLRRTIIPSVSAAFDDEELCNRVSTITAELLENAVKYGHWDSGDPSDFRLSVRGSETHMRVEVTNPVRDGAKSIGNLVALVDWIKRFPSPRDAYLTRLVEVANKELSEGQSGLGLVRLAYEAGCQLEVDLIQSGTVVSISGVIERAVERAQATKDLERASTGDLPELDVQISCSDNPNEPIRLIWRGRACHDRPIADLAPLLDGMLEQTSVDERPIEVHVKELDDICSTSAAVLLRAANNMLRKGRRLVIVHDRDRHWQRMTFEGLGAAGQDVEGLEFRAA